MNASSFSNNWQRVELLQLFSLSGPLAGLSITGVTRLHMSGKSMMVQTLADDALALSALLS